MKGDTAPIRVLVADDHPLYLDALERTIRSDATLELVASARDGNQALAAIERHEPDVAIVDIRMPGLEGVQVAARARAGRHPTRLLLISAFVDAEVAYRALSIGADGIVTKDVEPLELQAAIRRVARGESVLSARVQTALVGRIRAREQQAASPLTERERQVLSLAAAGLSNVEIGRRLYLGRETVKTHLRNTYTKLGTPGRASAVSAAVSRGLICVDDGGRPPTSGE